MGNYNNGIVMRGDNKTYWNWIKNQRQVDLELEEQRGEDDNLIKLLKEEIEEADKKIQEIDNGV